MAPQPNNDRTTSTPVPRWLTVGAWVTPTYSRMIPLRVEKINIDKIVLAQNNKGEMFAGHFSQLRPIRFRFPTLQEAYSWIGKVIDEGNGRRELVYLVDEDVVKGDDIGTERMLFINGLPAECLQEYSIDGHPFGVPEVDTDAEAQA